jgi:hypothetical protein
MDEPIDLLPYKGPDLSLLELLDIIRRDIYAVCGGQPIHRGQMVRLTSDVVEPASVKQTSHAPQT